MHQIVNQNGDKYFGEVNSKNNAHGRGVRFYSSGLIVIGNWYDDKYAPGKDIMVHGEYQDRIDVEEFYIDTVKRLKWRGTYFYSDGTSAQFDH